MQTLPPITGAALKETSIEWAEEIRARKLTGMQRFAAELRVQVGDDAARAATMDEVEATIYRLSQISQAAFWLNADTKRADRIIADAMR